VANLLQDLGAYLKLNSIVLNDGVDYFRDNLPDTPDNVVVAFESAGFGTTTGVDAVSRSVQIQVRNTSYAAARDKIMSIFRLLDKPLDRIVGLTSVRWGVISAQHNPFKLTVDKNGRVVFAFSFLIITYRD